MRRYEINAKAMTFNVLDKMRAGRMFTGYDLMNTVNRLCGEDHYPDTYLRYAREYRRKSGREIRNVDKRKSLYKIM